MEEAPSSSPLSQETSSSPVMQWPYPASPILDHDPLLYSPDHDPFSLLDEDPSSFDHSYFRVY